jgi:hypothetical protein
MKTIILTGLALACAGNARPASAQAAAPAGTPAPAPAAAWAMNVAPGRCTLSRGLGPAGDNIMSLSTLTGSDSYRLTLAGPAISRREQGLSFPATVTMTAADAHFPSTATGATLSGGRGAVIIYNLKAEFVAALGNATAMTVAAGHDNAGPYEVPRAHGAVAAFTKCVQDQLVDWGADAAQFAPGGATPVAMRERATWIEMRDIPRLSMTGPGVIAFAFRLGVTAEGAVDGCTPLDAAPRPDNTKTVCAAVMGQKLFKPAHDASGKGVRGAVAFEFQMVARRDTSR